MKLRNFGQAGGSASGVAEVFAPPESRPGDQLSYVELSAEARAELLDPNGWAGILETYARTTKLAVALTDAHGRMLGTCHNPQPVWRLAHEAAQDSSTRCPFCLIPHRPCGAVTESLMMGRVVIARDGAYLAHVAVPLSLGGHQLGSIIAGQVFDRYPEPLPLQKVAKQSGVSSQELWQHATRQVPTSRATLQVYGELLAVLGDAFLRQRYGILLDRKLVETDQRYRLLVEGVKDHALFTVDRRGRITSWNRGAEHLYAYTEAEIKGRDFSVLFTPEDVQAGEPGKLLQRALQAGSTDDEGWQMRKDGTRFLASGVLASLGPAATNELGRLTRDITERRKAEQALLASNKLESIGLLAGGIAHDFNNLLAGILLSVSCARAEMPPEDPSYSMLELAEQSSQKAAELTNQLLAYAGKGKFVITQFDFSALISEMMPLINSSIPKHVELHLALAADLPWMEGDASQIQQVIMNLVINGAESIGPEGGALWVSTGVLGTSIYMEVRDSGSGMDEVTKARMFDPFFTTKVHGRGLGLAAVSGIVRGHHGTLEVDSAPGEGTTFRISFPAIEPVAPTSPEICGVGTPKGTGVVLLVDDEPMLRGLAKGILERCGYSVLVAENGLDAVSVFRDNADDIATVVLDLTMPVMSGEEAYRQIREIRPDVPIIISSGYGEFFAREQFRPGEPVSFINKPYTPAKLVEKLSRLIPQRSHN